MMVAKVQINSLFIDSVSYFSHVLHVSKRGKIIGLGMLAIIIFTYLNVGYINAPPNNYTLDVSVNGGGSVNKDPQHPHYRLNDIVQLTAIPDQGWSFSGWSGDATGSENPTSITIDGDKAVTATFTKNEYTLTVSTSGSGNIIIAPEKSSYHYGDVVTLTAAPAAGWSFSTWSGDSSGSINPLDFTIDGNNTVTATFTKDEYTLSVSVSGTGSVSKDPDQATYSNGDSVQLLATPDAEWVFDHWTGDLTGSTNPDTISITGSMSVTAVFTQIEYTLTVTTIGSGSISKSLDQTTYHFSDIIQLTANPSKGYVFSGWSGDASGVSNPTTITIDGDKDVTATFTETPASQFTLIISAVGGGHVDPNPEGGIYDSNTEVQLTAVADPGWSFTSWSGELSGTSNPQSITMDGDKAVTATFTQSELTLTINAVGSGSVPRDNPGPYNLGDVVQLTAVADPGWSFSAWSGDLTSSTNPESITINGSKIVTVTFTQNEYTLTVTVNPTSSGTVTKNPDQVTYYYGENVTLSQVPVTGYAFTGWLGDGVNPGSDRVVTITGNMAVTASYTSIGGGGGGGGGSGGGGSVIIVPAVYTITFGSRDQKGTNNLGELLFSSQRRDLPSSSSMVKGDYTLSYTPESYYLFDHWETLGNLTVTNPLSTSTILTVRGNGTITAMYAPRIFKVAFESREENGTSKKLGSYILENITISSGDSFNREFGNYSVTFHPSGEYVFYKWETTDGVRVSDTMNNTASLLIQGSGRVTAVYIVPKGDIKIVVKDTDGNQVPNATVTVYPPQKQGAQFVGLTDSEGSVVFKNVIIGQYDVNVTKEDYVKTTLTISPKMKSLVTGNLALVKQNYILTIRVLDQSKNPMAGVNVTLFGGPIGWQPLKLSTDLSGLTMFKGVFLRKYFVLISSKGYLSQIAGVVIEDVKNNTSEFTLKSSPAENESESQPLMLMEVTIGAALILIFLVYLAWIFTRR